MYSKFKYPLINILVKMNEMYRFIFAYMTALLTR